MPRAGGAPIRPATRIPTAAPLIGGSRFPPPSYGLPVPFAATGTQGGTPSAAGTSSYDRWTAQAVADAAGRAVVQLAAPASVGFYVDRLAVETTSANPTHCTVYVGQAMNASTVQDDTSQGNDDIADEDQPLWVQPGATLFVEWVGATPGASCTVNSQLRRPAIA